MKHGIWHLIVFCLGLASLHGCSSSMAYKAGLYTKTVTGTFSVEQATSAKQLFVLVLDYHRTLIEMERGYLNRVTASVVYPDEKGHYEASFAADSVKLELIFYAHNSQLSVQEFQRTLGVGSYQFHVKLKEDKDWQTNYYLFIKPTLVEYITEKRYQMSQIDKFFIGEWLSKADERL